jgi:hypothetical protein
VRTTVRIDDELYREALAFAEPGMNKSELLRAALQVFIRVQAAKTLAALGGAAPGMANVVRRRAEAMEK